MNKFSLYVRLLYFVVFVFATVLFLFSPEIIVVHFNNGIPDEYDNRMFLYVFFIISVLIGEISIFFSKYYRKKENTQEFPLLFPGEIRFLQVYLLINLAFICAMIQQVLTS
ncbi:hypothetical protein [Streptococcus lutetiensis]|uniref:hypothetical protein n=1 Tax=Streptococcus lutetiensis TaxID=150055 RepID=UPI001964FE29|nr:hypothetical protein [Streptococcus lutetiensis]